MLFFIKILYCFIFYILFFLASMYALGLQFKLINDLTKLIVDELLVKITGFSSGTTPYLSIYFSNEDASITPGKSLFLKEINLSI